MNKRIFAFGEGVTEKTVWNKLHSKLPQSESKIGGAFHAVGGKSGFKKKMLDILEPEFCPGGYVRVVVFRDVDKGEDIQQILPSFKNLAQDLLSCSIELVNHPNYTNVFVADIQPTDTSTGMRFVLHLAATPSLLSSAIVDLGLRNQTTDTYILALALLDSVLERFAREAKTKKDILESKVVSEIPNLFQKNGIRFDEDKDLLAAYLVATRFWTVKRTDQKERLVKIILDRAFKYDSQNAWKVFASWRAAIEEVVP
ncbi:MAG: hypothetical protein U9Q70_13420 [Chloroflexota bacterium]|nr:hypothetical protein [Chloroflexota bacterium]